MGVTLIFLKEQLTFNAGISNPMQELQLHMMSAFSQFERALLKERQADGIAAKKRGEKNRASLRRYQKVQEIDELRSRGVRLRIACDHTGLGVSTYYKLRNLMKTSNREIISPSPEAIMKLTFQIVITDESGSSRTEELMSLQKSGDALNDIGLSVSESKQLLGAVQKSLVQQQADEYIHQNIQYPMSSLPYEAQNQRPTKI